MRNWVSRLLGQVTSALKKLTDDEKGASTAEYALILTLIVVILITTLTQLGNALDDKLRDIITQIQGARGGQ